MDGCYTPVMTFDPAIILPGTHLIPEKEGRDRLGRQIRIKFGVDPTSANLHLGHAVALRQLRKLQDAGHLAILVIGNFTAAIGDPTGRNTTRPPLSDSDIEANAQTYLDQAFMVLDRNKTEVVHNKDWLGAMTAADIIRMAAAVTVSQMSQRNDFAQRLSDQTPVCLHEFLYPLFQGQDSVHLDCDAELGGTDQTFNLMMGRDMQSRCGKDAQFIMTVPLLVGLDGSKKMSKSHGNQVGLMDDPVDKFSKIMRLPDFLIPEWGRLLTSIPEDSWKDMMHSKGARDAKFSLAREVVSWLHSPEVSEKAGQAWEAAVKQSIGSDAIPLVQVSMDPVGMDILSLLVQVGLASSKTVARQKIQEGAVRIDGQRIDEMSIKVTPGLEILLQVGKRNFRRVSTSA